MCNDANTICHTTQVSGAVVDKPKMPVRRLPALTRGIAALSVAAALGAVGHAQGSAGGDFEVASIHRSPQFSSGAIRLGRAVTPGRLAMLGVTPKDLIMWAYELEPYQVQGPRWISEEWYGLNAKAPEPAPEDRLRLMLQSVLALRFRMVTHREIRNLPVYLLTVAKNGPKIRPIEGVDDAPRYYPKRQGVAAWGITMRRFAELLSSKLERPVTDMTQLRGQYDIELAWSQDVEPSNAANAELNPLIFTAIQEQLGLKLQPTKGPLQMLVIDQIDHPSEN
jgi:uncharacterized protein (TIGR03435 family)